MSVVVLVDGFVHAAVERQVVLVISESSGRDLERDVYWLLVDS